MQTLTNNLLKPNQKLENFEHAMETIHDSIQGIEVEKEKTLRRFSLLRNHLSPQITIIKIQLEECITTKTSYDKFMFTDLNVVELASYALCVLISVSDALKNSWKKHLA